ncbi:WXG100 family type VII secretion target [Yinghuangia seranimata]|uniref:WXG100 family type VII secretion target n=1 Tax=Yinghuangia seranimata TaxID=408067 RepID=UPI00248B16BC|nr:WXG100 family type VII secretion target [Yinghuangia seranimata]MDI2128187.1 hypothetical protein [Yinghuangia seranimata]
MTGEQTDFTQYSHAQMVGMLAPAKGTNIVEAGQRIVRVSEAIRYAAAALKSKTETVQWDGQAANDFRTWSDQLVASTQQLAEYAHASGNALQVVGNKVASTHLPPVPAGAQATLTALQQDPKAGAEINPTTGKSAMQEALDSVNGPHQEAAAQMRALAATYSATTQDMAGLRAPDFKDPVNMYDVRPQIREDENNYGAAAGLVGAAAVGALAGQGGLHGGAGGRVASVSGMGAAPPPAWPPAAPAGVPSVVAPTPHPGASGSAGNLLGYNAPGNPSAPAPTAPVQGVNRGLPATVSGTPGPLPGISGGNVRTGGSGPGETGVLPGRGGGKVGGSTSVSSGSGSVKGAQPASGASREGMPAGGVGLRGGGIEGGRPRTGAVAAEGGAVAGGGRPPGAIGGGGAAGAAGSGGARGRGGAGNHGTPSVAGGVVGGTPRSSVGHGFSPGGAGLGGSRVGMIRPGANEPEEERRRRSRERADYLEEDEETWGGRNPGTVPPVIG